MSNIQAVLFDLNYFDSNKARNYLKKHNLKPIKRVHKTEKYLRYRLKQPNNNHRYITKNISKGIKYIIKI